MAAESLCASSLTLPSPIARGEGDSFAVAGEFRLVGFDGVVVPLTLDFSHSIGSVALAGSFDWPIEDPPLCA
jgi:hypothetical protein